MDKVWVAVGEGIVLGAACELAPRVATAAVSWLERAVAEGGAGVGARLALADGDAVLMMQGGDRFIVGEAEAEIERQRQILAREPGSRAAAEEVVAGRLSVKGRRVPPRLSETVDPVHHIASIESTEFTPSYRQIFKEAGMNLKDDANEMTLVGHDFYARGGHSRAYKEWVLELLEHARDLRSANLELAERLRKQLGAIRQALNDDVSLLKVTKIDELRALKSVYI
jgi:hypothetical protein